MSAFRRAAAAILLLAAPPWAAASEQQHALADVPYVPTPPAVVEAMFDIVKLEAKDYVIDLGSGDGRIVIQAAKRRGARGLGVEIDKSLVGLARAEARRQGVEDRAQFIDENLFVTDLRRATVLAMYLYPRLMLQLRPRLFEQLAPGSRVVSHDFEMEGWQPDARVTVPVPDKPYGAPSSEVYLWVIPANAAGTWQWRADGAPWEAVLGQTFQMLDGTAGAAGRRGRVEGGRMRGDEIRFMLTAEVDGRAVRHEFSGRVAGDAIRGRVRLADGSDRDWSATRVRRAAIKVGDE